MRTRRLDAFARSVTAALLAAAAAFAVPSPALGGNPSRLNVDVSVQGIAGVSDLTATPGNTNGTIDLVWTEPRRNGTTGPYSYDIRVSTVANLNTHAAFLSAQPLTAFSPSPVPTPGAGGGQVGMVVTGLSQGVVHYFAIRELDSLGAFGAWVRAGARNISNFASAQSGVPAAVTDLTALAGPGDGQVSLSWTAPQPPILQENRVFFATFSVADVGGSTTAWYAAAGVSTTPAVATPGSLETAVAGLNPGELYWFGLKVVNDAGLGVADSKSVGGPQVTARAKGVSGVTNLAAAPGLGNGAIALSWTTPYVSSTTAPLAYQLRVSTLGFINGATDYAASAPLAAFSTTTLPAVGAPGTNASLNVTGLNPSVTYYFALRAVDSSTPTLAGPWLRVPALGRNPNTAAVPTHVFSAPDAITDLSALPGTLEGDVALSWTAPRNQDGVAIASYEVRYAQLPVSAFGGSTTAWAAAASSQAFSPALPPGATQAFTLSGLYPAATWYFAVKSIDALGDVSYLDTLSTSAFQPRSLPRNFAPAAVSGLSATAGFKRAVLSWTDLTVGQKGLDFRHYRLERSTDDLSYAPVTTMTATGYTDRPLTANVTYYYRVAAVDFGGYESVSSTASAVPYAPGPMEPLGLNVVSNSTSTTISWNPVTRFSEGTLFESTGAPTADELQGYKVMRSTVACAPSFVQLSTLSFSTTSITDATLGLNYFYRIYSFNTQGLSANPVTLTALGDRGFFLDDCDSTMFLDSSITPMLNGATNGLGGDIRVVPTRRPQDVGGQVFQSAEWKAYLNGVTELKDFVWPKPVRVTLHFETDASGAPKASTSAYSPSALGAAAAGPSAASAKHLGMYWYNGGEFKKMYGTVDQANQTVSIQTPNLGVYQIRSLFRADGAVFDLSNLSGRVVTPNGDGLNDLIIFSYDPGPTNVQARGQVYDVTGRFVADMVPGAVPNTLTWDGRMNGRAAASGVYVYRITGDGKTFTGTVVVAK